MQEHSLSLQIALEFFGSDLKGSDSIQLLNLIQKLNLIEFLFNQVIVLRLYTALMDTSKERDKEVFC